MRIQSLLRKVRRESLSILRAARHTFAEERQLRFALAEVTPAPTLFRSLKR